MPPLQGKTALITGASSGIGRATSLRLAELGARVALCSRSAAALDAVAAEVRARGLDALVLPTDVTDPEQCRAAVEATVKEWGRLDLLLCSAGVSMRAAFAESDP